MPRKIKHLSNLLQYYTKYGGETSQSVVDDNILLFLLMDVAFFFDIVIIDDKIGKLSN